MSDIFVLPAEISNQIAAGEVVERPASVVKELIENSIDAAANIIEIYMSDGGKSLIKIRDNGSGMSPEDAQKCVERHATSKIKTIEDLFAVQSFGFRGEALAAISSVSNFELLTKRDKDINGTKITIAGGTNKKVVTAPSNTGTTIEITDLFWPTPARLAHLKNSQTEFGHIYKEIISFALCYPHIGFKIFKDNKLYKHFPHTKTEDFHTAQKNRYLQLLNVKDNDLIFFTEIIDQTTISGCLIKPGLCLRNKKKQYMFVNNRRIEDFRLAYAVREAYVQSAGIEKHLHPLFVLKIHTDPILVDVNVHPRKLEVKFAEPYETYRNVKGVCIQQLEKYVKVHSHMPQQKFAENQAPHFSSKNPSFAQKQSNTNFHQTLHFSARSNQRDQNYSERQSPLTSDTEKYSYFSSNNTLQTLPETLQTKEKLILIGQVANKYIMAEGRDGLWMFDQHALHERQRFEVFWNAYQNQKKNSQIAVQKALVPIEINMDIETVQLFINHQDLLKKIGITYELKDDETLIIKSVPQLLAKEKLGQMFADLTEYLDNEKIGEHVLDSFMRKRLEYKSCRGAVMFGDPLDRIEMQHLLDDFLTTKWRNLCPHGRPNHWFIPFGELDQKFHR